MITWPVASSTEPTVLPVVFVTRFVVYSACSDAHPETAKSAPATNKIGRICFFFDIREFSEDELGVRPRKIEQNLCPETLEFVQALRSKMKSGTWFANLGSIL